MSPFKSIIFELSNAIHITKQDHQNNFEDNLKKTTTGVPNWAFFLGFGLLGIVGIMVFIGNCINRRITAIQQVN